MDIGPPELIIILIIVLLLFGGSRLAGLGKSAGRALKEFKEETADASRVTTPPQNMPAVPMNAPVTAVTPTAPAAPTAPTPDRYVGDQPS